MKILDHLEEWLIAFLMGAATLVIFVAVAASLRGGRADSLFQDALLKIDLSWAQELCIYMFVWMAKFGAAYGVRTGIHVGVDVLINRLPPDRARPTCCSACLRAPCSPASSARSAPSSSWDIAHTDSTSPDLEMPKWIVYLCIPLGSYLMCFRFLQVAWSFARTGELPQHDVAHVEGVEPSATSTRQLPTTCTRRTVEDGNATSRRRGPVHRRTRRAGRRWSRSLSSCSRWCLKLAGVCRSTTRGSSSRC